MGFKPTSSSTRTLIPEDTHEAYCIGVAVTGTHESKPWKGEQKPPKKKIVLTFEFPEILREFKEGEGDKPAWKSINYTFSIGERSNLYKLLSPWLGDLSKFNWYKLPGTPCSVTIKHEAGTDGKIWDNIVGVTSISKKYIDSMAKRISETFIYDVEDDGFEGKNWNKLPEWIQKEAMKSLEYQAHTPDDEDLPPFK